MAHTRRGGLEIAKSGCRWMFERNSMRSPSYRTPVNEGCSRSRYRKRGVEVLRAERISRALGMDFCASREPESCFSPCKVWISHARFSLDCSIAQIWDVERSSRGSTQGPCQYHSIQQSPSQNLGISPESLVGAQVNSEAIPRYSTVPQIQRVDDHQE